MGALTTERVPKVFFGIFAVLLFALVVSDTPPKVALIAATFVSVQIFVGGIIFALLVKRTDLIWQEF